LARTAQVDHDLEFVRQLHWQIAGLGPLKKAIDIIRRAAEYL
jgi:hypothetical protein